jgi:hypothetical protein
MKTKLLFLDFLISTGLFAQIGTGFEEPSASVTVDYVDTQSPLNEHFLMHNSGGQPSVNHVYVGGELGFQTTFIPTRNGASGDDGLTDGDAFGVFTDAGIILGTDATSWTTGNAFLIEDVDGTARIEFDLVTLAGTTAPRFQIDYWVDDSTYEFSNNANDRLFIGLDIDNGASMITVFDSDGGGPGGGGSGDIDALGIETVLQSADIDLSAHIGSNVRLIVEADCNSTAERFIIDNILFTEGAINALDVNDLDVSFGLKVYPNPIQDELNINAIKTITGVRVFNMLGQKVLDIEPNMMHSKLDMSSLNSGTYFLQVSADDKIKTVKVVKE